MRFLRAALLSLSLLVAAPVSAGVVLSEIMFDPLDDEDTDEYLELYNDSSLPVNLLGWLLTDGEGGDSLADAGLGMLALPRQYVLILDSDYIEEARTTYDSLVSEDALVLTISGSTLGSRGLSNSEGETITLVNAQGQTVASWMYSIGNASGHSDEKRVMSGGDEFNNWEDSEALHGTPGFRNSVTPLDRNLCICDFWASPETPEAGSEFGLTAVIKNSGLQAMSGAVRLLYDDSGGTDFVDVNRQSFDLIASGDSASVEFSQVMPGSGLARYEAVLDSADDDSSDSRRELLISSTPLTSGLVINEMMIAPLSGRAEWVELHNSGASVVLTGGLTFGDGRGIADTSERISLPDWLLAPGEYSVLADDSAIFFEAIADSVSVLVWSSAITLNNNGDSLCLWRDDILLDRVDYRPSWSSGNAGISLERVSASSASNDAANWGDCVDDNGSTPGRVNSRSIPGSHMEKAGLVSSPDPFTPNGDGERDVTQVTFSAGRAISDAEIVVYDIRGRIIRTLAAGGSAIGTGSVIWDGRADDQRMMPSGRYVLFLKARPTEGGEITAKSSVILARPR